MRRFIILIMILFSLSGCSLGQRTIRYDIASLAKDHTIGIVSNPFSAAGSLLSRIKIFTTETLWRMHLDFFCYPFLSSKIPPVSDKREYFNKQQFNKWLDGKTGGPVKGNVRILLSGESFFPVLEQNIQKAEKYINISTYIFDNDQYGLFFADLLKKKSKKISVKVISDMLGSVVAWEISDEKQGKSKGVSPDIFSYLTDNSDVRIRRSRNIWLASDHTKMIIIDGKKVFFGGMNIGNEYRYEWRDSMFEVTGDLTEKFQKVFNHSWYKYSFCGDLVSFFSNKFHYKKKNKDNGAKNFHILRTTSYRHDIYNAQIEAARRAKNHIFVENPYIWNEAFLYELCAARNRGVDVRVTIPGIFDAKTFSGINKRVANTLLKYGVRIFIYPGVSHIKAASFDDWVCFGTANFDDLSFHKNNEINLATSDPEFVQKFKQDILINGQIQSSELKDFFQIELTDWITHGLKDYF